MVDEMEVKEEHSENTNGSPNSVTIHVGYTEPDLITNYTAVPYKIVFVQVDDGFMFKRFNAHLPEDVNRRTLNALGLAIDHVAEHYGPVVENGNTV